MLASGAGDSPPGLQAMVEKNIDAFRTISEVAEDLDLPQHVLRFWETRFPQIKPMKRGGGRRYYRPDDVELLRAIRQLLYGEGYTIKGVQRILKEQGPRAVAAAVAAGAVLPQRSAVPARDDDQDYDEAAYESATEEPGDAPPAPTSAPTAPQLAPRASYAPPPSMARQPAMMAPARPTPAPVIAPAPARPSGVLGDLDVRRLRAALADLAECERILAAARRL